MHLHAHTNSTPEITLTGMCVVSGTTGENAEKTRRRTEDLSIEEYILLDTHSRNEITFGFLFFFFIIRIFAYFFLDTRNNFANIKNQ